ncbi:hypothetical protein [Candidatus Nardonella dryophthoridicola]|uniref:Uncharacterized protein n=1 Tax=endosymbiont of Metamasius hemipterus TaxID=204627 RepID=A0ABT0TWC2_9GAMM|nr:hypothetical protein [Candidatus Nardonella dryophthoridicola]MCM0158288.1 hypothetical protein [endosymbiont of Metamasius hemipterus]
MRNKKKSKLHNICSMVILLFKILIIYLKPIIPNISNNIEKYLGIKLIKDEIFIHNKNIKLNNFIKYKKIKIEDLIF